MNVSSDPSRSTLQQNYGYLKDDKSILSSQDNSSEDQKPRMAILRSQLPQHLQDDLSKIDPSNLPAGVKVYNVETLPRADSSILTSKIEEIAKAQAELKNLAEQREKLEKTADNFKKMVVKTFIQALQITEIQFLDFVDPKEMTIRYSKESRCLRLDIDTMMNIVIPSIQKYKPRALDFSVFKNQITEEALINFFEAAPSLSITGVRLSKDINLTQRQIDIATRIREEIKQTGRQFSVVIK